MSKSKYEKNRERIKRELWDNLPVGMFSTGEIDVMACALARAMNTILDEHRESKTAMPITAAKLAARDALIGAMKESSIRSPEQMADMVLDGLEDRDGPATGLRCSGLALVPFGRNSGQIVPCATWAQA